MASAAYVEASAIARELQAAFDQGHYRLLRQLSRDSSLGDREKKIEEARQAVEEIQGQRLAELERVRVLEPRLEPARMEICFCHALVLRQQLHQRVVDDVARRRAARNLVVDLHHGRARRTSGPLEMESADHRRHTQRSRFHAFTQRLGAGLQRTPRLHSAHLRSGERLFLPGCETPRQEVDSSAMVSAVGNRSWTTVLNRFRNSAATRL